MKVHGATALYAKLKYLSYKCLNRCLGVLEKEVKLFRIGGSDTAMVIPSAIAKIMGLKAGMKVRITYIKLDEKKLAIIRSVEEKEG